MANKAGGGDAVAAPVDRVGVVSVNPEQSEAAPVPELVKTKSLAKSKGKKK
jgi:hypothetical protein